MKLTIQRNIVVNCKHCSKVNLKIYPCLINIGRSHMVMQGHILSEKGKKNDGINTAHLLNIFSTID